MENSRIIATTDLVRLRPDGNRDKLKLIIYEPILNESPVNENLRYSCESELLIFSARTTTAKFFGKDSFSALQQAMTGIGEIVAGLPFSDELYVSGFPNFGFPLNPHKVAKSGLPLTTKQSALVKISTGEKLDEQEKAVIKKLQKLK